MDQLNPDLDTPDSPDPEGTSSINAPTDDLSRPRIEAKRFAHWLRAVRHSGRTSPETLQARLLAAPRGPADEEGEARGHITLAYVATLRALREQITALEQQISQQLAAELLYLNVLPLSNVAGNAKRARITTVLKWVPEPATIPANLDSALDSGVFNGGIGFNTTFWAQLVHLIAFVPPHCQAGLRHPRAPGPPCRA